MNAKLAKSAYLASKVKSTGPMAGFAMILVMAAKSVVLLLLVSRSVKTITASLQKQLYEPIAESESEELPLGKHRPGGRGWLCKVLEEGVIRPGDVACKM